MEERFLVVYLPDASSFITSNRARVKELEHDDEYFVFSLNAEEVLYEGDRQPVETR